MQQLVDSAENVQVAPRVSVRTMLGLKAFVSVMLAFPLSWVQGMIGAVLVILSLQFALLCVMQLVGWLPRAELSYEASTPIDE